MRCWWWWWWWWYGGGGGGGGGEVVVGGGMRNTRRDRWNSSPHLRLSTEYVDQMVVVVGLVVLGVWWIRVGTDRTRYDSSDCLQGTLIRGGSRGRYEGCT